MYTRLTSIVLLTHNRWDRTVRCLESLCDNREMTSVQLVWIDNASTDETIDEMRKWLPRLRGTFFEVAVRQNRSNGGFLGGVNQAISLCAGELVCLLNNDTVLPAEWLSRLTRLLDDEAIGAAGPVSDGMPFDQHWKSVLRGTADVPVVYGFCLLTRLELFYAAGLLDERYGRGVIEIEDWCERVARLGYRFRVDRDLVVLHDEPHASYTPRVNKLLTIRNRNLFRAKWSRGPYHWDDTFSSETNYVRSNLLLHSDPCLEMVERMTRTLVRDEELIVIRKHRNGPDHSALPATLRADPRINFVCVPTWPLSSHQIRQLVAANARSLNIQPR